jgi:hypothetical protein
MRLLGEVDDDGFVRYGVEVGLVIIINRPALAVPLSYQFKHESRSL